MEFLDSVLESTRAQEAAVKRQTREQLELFKLQQEEAEAKAREAEGEPKEEEVKTETWSVSRKRKKGREDLVGKVKLRKGSSSAGGAKAVESEGNVEAAAVEEDAAKPENSHAVTTGAAPKIDHGSADSKPEENVKEIKEAPKPSASPVPGLGLGLDAYSSDDD